MRKTTSGFTIVELLIVIVVIAILAAISIVAYSGIQTRARDSKRASDISQIKKALVAYEIVNSGVSASYNYNPTGSAIHSGWDSSNDADWLSFLRSGNGFMPVDPVNSLGGNQDPSGPGNFTYFYYCYGTGSGPNPATPNVSLGYHKSDGTLVTEDFAVSSCI